MIDKLARPLALVLIAFAFARHRKQQKSSRVHRVPSVATRTRSERVQGWERMAQAGPQAEPKTSDGGPKKMLQRINSYQQRHAWLGFPLAVAKKFGDDGAANLAGLIAYYGFFSIFPLLLAFVAILGFVLSDNPQLQQRILDSALTQFPVVGEQIAKNIGSLQGKTVALVVGVVGALWAGLAVINAAQNAFNEVWDVTIENRPSFPSRTLRSLIALVLLGTAALAAAVLAGVGSGSGTLAAAWRVAGIAASVALNLVVFLVAFRVLTARDLSWSTLVPGAILAAVVWEVLHLVGGYYVANQIRGASETYGAFAIVIGLLAWLYLGAQITLYAAEVNVVRARRLWPRSLIKEQLTQADRRALAAQAREEQRIPSESVEVEFGTP